GTPGACGAPAGGAPADGAPGALGGAAACCDPADPAGACTGACCAFCWSCLICSCFCICGMPTKSCQPSRSTAESAIAMKVFFWSFMEQSEIQLPGARLRRNPRPAVRTTGRVQQYGRSGLNHLPPVIDPLRQVLPPLAVAFA